MKKVILKPYTLPLFPAEIEGDSWTYPIGDETLLPIWRHTTYELTVDDLLSSEECRSDLPMSNNDADLTLYTEYTENGADNTRVLIFRHGIRNVGYLEYILPPYTPLKDTLKANELFLVGMQVRGDYAHEGLGKRLLGVVKYLEPQVQNIAGFATNKVSGKILRHPNYELLPELEEIPTDLTTSRFGLSAKPSFYFNTNIERVHSIPFCIYDFNNFAQRLTDRHPIRHRHVIHNRYTTTGTYFYTV